MSSKLDVGWTTRNSFFARAFCLLALGVLLSPGCTKSKDLFGTASQVLASKSDLLASAGGFDGCIDGTGIDTSTIQLNFEFPSDAKKMNVYRDGVLIYTSDSASNTSFLDTDLQEGKLYTYTCEASINGKAIKGNKSLTLNTTSINAPTFAGIVTATATSAHSATVRWNPASGVLASTYKVYANPGSLSGDLNWAANPVAIVRAGTLSTTISGLGDEMTYVFGVRACALGDICDENIVAKSATLPDDGAPLTNGATNAEIVNGRIVLTVPWTHAKGRVLKRHVYVKTGATSMSLDDYTLSQTYLVTNQASVPTSIEVGNMCENATYNFVVRDEDSTFDGLGVGQRTPAFTIDVKGRGQLLPVTISTGDLTAPNFGGITLLDWGTPADTNLVAKFVAISSQPVDPNGANKYIIYKTEVAGNGSVANPCTSGTILTELTASDYSSGSVVSVPLSGLTTRTKYAVCIKAKDQAGNISSNDGYQSKITRDLTAPTFDGIQSIAFNNITSKLEVRWNPSLTSDVSYYQVKIWKNGNTALAFTSTKSHASFSTGADFINPNDFPGNILPLTEGDTIYAVVNACDDAAPIYNTAANCTTRADNTAKSILLTDVGPPQGFNGITSAGPPTPNADGSLYVTWSGPPGGSMMWADYKGFRIYTVTPDHTLSMVGDCLCQLPECADELSGCTIPGQSPGKLANFYVRAFDARNNYTAAEMPYNSSYQGRVGDATPPVFSSGLTAGVQRAPSTPGVLIDWEAASDNQDAGNSLHYKVYRKKDSTFSWGADGKPTDGMLITTVDNSTIYLDPASADLGGNYYYTVCAVDDSLNTNCNQVIKNIWAPDLIPPTVTNLIANPTIAKLEAPWTLAWSMSDNATQTSALKAFVWVRESTINTDFPTPSSPGPNDRVYTIAPGVMSYSAPSYTGAGVKYFNYVVVVKDGCPDNSCDGNAGQAQISVKADNTPVYSRHYGWTEIKAVGPLVSKDYWDTNTSFKYAESGPYVSLRWPNMGSSDGATVNRYVAYRSNTQGSGYQQISGYITWTPTTSTYTDTTVVAGTKYYYIVKAVTSGSNTPMDFDNAIDKDFEVEVQVPPDNMVLIHRWMANKDICGQMNKTIDRTNNYRCLYKGPGRYGYNGGEDTANVGYFDFGHSFLVDRNEVGCNFTSTDTYGRLLDGSNGSLQGRSYANWPTGTFGQVGEVAHNSAYQAGSSDPTGPYGRCFYKVDVNTWINMKDIFNASLLTTTQQTIVNSNRETILQTIATNMPGVPPLGFVTQAEANYICSLMTPNGFGTKRLLSRKEHLAASAWAVGMSWDDQLKYTTGLYRTVNYPNGCNTTTLHDNSPYDENFTIPNTSFNHAYVSYNYTDKMIQMTGAPISSNCVSRYGAQDLIGNLSEWTSDKIDCGYNSMWCLGITGLNNNIDFLNVLVQTSPRYSDLNNSRTGTSGYRVLEETSYWQVPLQIGIVPANVQPWYDYTNVSYYTATIIDSGSGNSGQKHGARIFFDLSGFGSPGAIRGAAAGGDYTWNQYDVFSTRNSTKFLLPESRNDAVGFRCAIQLE